MATKQKRVTRTLTRYAGNIPYKTKISIKIPQGWFIIHGMANVGDLYYDHTTRSWTTVGGPLYVGGYICAIREDKTQKELDEKERNKELQRVSKDLYVSQAPAKICYKDIKYVLVKRTAFEAFSKVVSKLFNH